MPRLYLAGPMTGHPEFNFPAFHAAARAWRAAGWDVLNPAEAFGGATDLPYTEYVRHDIQLLKSAQAIAMLPGWDAPGARGSVWEREIAAELGLMVYDAEHPVAPPAGADQTLTPTNPKDAIGSDKLPLHLWPVTASAYGAVAMLDGALKYGRDNFRAIGVRASIYVDACQRHLAAWFEGEDDDPDSGVPHLGHALACLAIVVDAMAAGKLHDDRKVPGGFREAFIALTPHVKRLKAMHAARDPKHYTIADAEATH